jgi:hypothetical protein
MGNPMIDHYADPDEAAVIYSSLAAISPYLPL